MVTTSVRDIDFLLEYLQKHMVIDSKSLGQHHDFSRYLQFIWSLPCLRPTSSPTWILAKSHIYSPY